MSGAERTTKDLLELQSLPLSRKILITQTRIAEWYQRFGGEYMSPFLAVKTPQFFST